MPFKILTYMQTITYYWPSLNLHLSTFLSCYIYFDEEIQQFDITII